MGKTLHKEDKKSKKDKKDKKEKKERSSSEDSGSADEVAANPEVSTPVVKPNLQIFVSGIPYEATVDMLKEYFNQGDNKSLSQNIIEIKLPLYQDSGKCRGFAHVEFRDQKTYD
jgi:nucleolin